MPVDWMQALAEGGRLAVPVEPPPEDPQAWAAGLEALAERAAWELPGAAPGLSLTAAHWAGARVLVACQGIAYRGVVEERLSAALSLPCPEPLSPTVAWSVDLTLRQLPRLLRLAAGFPSDDPLRVGLRALAGDWPLSSVGVSGLAIEPSRLEPVVSHPALLRLYTDRVLAAGSCDRLTPHVREAAQVALGDHTDLCPALASALAGDPQEAHDADRA